jgi:hypothetical protein
MPAHGYGESQAFDSQAAEDKGRAREGIRKENQRSNGKKKSHGHHQQSCVLHSRSFPWSGEIGDNAFTKL